MKKIVLSLIVTHAVIVVCYGMDIESFIQPNNFELHPKKIDALKEVATSDCLEDSLTAHALLCADYINKDSSKNLYSNVIYHAGIVLKENKPSWQSIYVQLTLLVLHSTGYMPDYNGQVKRANELKDRLNTYEWDDIKNPIFTHLTSSDQFTKKKIMNMVDYFLVQAYCNLSQVKNAQGIYDKMTDNQMRNNASNLIKSHEIKIEKLER